MAMTAAIVATVGVGMISAKGQREEGLYQKAIYEQNERIANEQAKDAIARGRYDEAQHRLQIRSLIGEQRATMAAQGIEINDPDQSAGAVQLSTRAQGEYDAILIRNNAAREAWGYKVQGYNASLQGHLADVASRNRARDTILGSLVKAGGTYASSGAGPRK